MRKLETVGVYCTQMDGQLILITLAATQLLSSPTLPSSLFQHSTSVVILATHSFTVSCTSVQRTCTHVPSDVTRVTRYTRVSAHLEPRHLLVRVLVVGHLLRRGGRLLQHLQLSLALVLEVLQITNNIKYLCRVIG